MEKMTVCKYGAYETIYNNLCKANVYIDFHNSRVKLLDYYGHTDSIIQELFKICIANDLGKIICTVYEADLNTFLSNGFLTEGKIEGYFKGETAFCAAYFNHQERSISKYIDEEDTIVRQAMKFKATYIHSQEHIFKLRTAARQDAEKLSNLFGLVFKTYPTPMNNPEYIKEVINSQVLFKVAEIDNEIVSAASADMNKELLNSEITDCATLESFRGKGFLSELIFSLENDLRHMGFITAFSLCRARSHGINIVLSKHGYEYMGRHINNCNIMGGFEDMNIWVKKLKF